MSEPMAIPGRARAPDAHDDDASPFGKAIGSVGEAGPPSMYDKDRSSRTPSPSPPFSPPAHSVGGIGAHSFDGGNPMRWIPKRAAVRAQAGASSLLSDSLSGGGKEPEPEPTALTVLSPDRLSDVLSPRAGAVAGVLSTSAAPLARLMSSSYPPTSPSGRRLTLGLTGAAAAGGRGGARGGRGGGGRGGDWRKSFVMAATTANKKAEYLHGSQCRETHELNDVLAETVLALERGIKPDLTEDGLGGTYFVKDRTGKPVAVFKPRDEEPLGVNNPKAHAGDGTGEGLNEGVNVGEAAMNEYAAYLLDQSSHGALRAGVCPTALVRMAHSTFHTSGEDRCGPFRSIKDKVGSFQLFAAHDCTAEDIGSSKFLPEHVHAIAVLDIRLCNTDRHPGNILVREQKGVVTGLVPIDHGYALPGEVGSAEFEWLHYPAAKQPFSDAVREEILAIDVMGVDAMLRRRIQVLRAACLHTLAVCTTLLQRGVAEGLTAHDIGSIMMRPYCRRDEEPRPSDLEELVAEAKLQGDSTEPMMVCFARLAGAKCEEVAAVKAREAKAREQGGGGR